MNSLDGIQRPSLTGFKQASASAIDRAKLMVGLKQEIEEDLESQASERSFVDNAADLICPDLSFQQRVIGFGVCFTVGYLITFMSFKFFVELIEGYPVPFAMNYTCGNILALGSSWFLCGPSRQFKNMFDERRRITAILYLSCLGSTLVVVFLPLPSALKLFLLILLLLTQCGSSFWYSLSYVPFGRKTVLKVFKRMLGLNESPLEGP